MTTDRKEPREQTAIEKRTEVAATLNRCADRLARFVELKAPEIVIEAERSLMLQVLLSFPVDQQAQLAHQHVKDLGYAHEHAFLHDKGYYDDVMREIGEEPGHDH